MENYIGKNIESYKIVSLLGKGGMGVVYKAYDTKLDRYVAIKMLNSQNNDNERFIERFKKEARNQAKLLHQNIATVYGFIEFEGNLGIVMEYIDGESLEKIIYRRKRLNSLDAIFIIKNVLQGLSFAHSKGFIHRDIKPSNIILTKDNSVKIMDFGISKSIHEKGMTKTGAKVGTLYYMSPEQVKGGDLTIQSDIYSVGCTFYEMLVGQPPFFSDSDFDVMEGHLKKEEPKVSKMVFGLPEQLDKIISISMKKNANERYLNCNDFIYALEELEKGIAKYHSSKPVNLKKDPKKIKIYSTIGFSVFIVILLSLSYFIYSQVHELLNSNKLEELDKYNIKTLFTEDLKFDFNKVKKIDLGTSKNINFVNFFGSTAIVGADSGLIFLSYNNGESWIPKNIDSSLNFFDGCILKDGTAFLIGNKSEIISSNNYFDSITRVTFSSDFSLFRVYFIDQNTGFVLGSKGTLMITKDKGVSWQKINVPTQDILYDISFSDSINGTIVGWNGLILKTENGGYDWKKISSNTSKYLRSIDYYEDYGIIAGGSGEVLKSVDGGSNWQVIKSGIMGSISSIMYLDDKNIMAVGSKGSFIFSNNSGKNFNVYSTKTYINFTRVCKNKNGSVFVSGNNGTLLKLN
ncbi:MAG TPA: protein kinase [Melioribacteraceae bacterium]|nr:protein kinase [Melioribacteraceae bacterium]